MPPRDSEIAGIDVEGRTIIVTTDQPSLIEFIGRGGDILASFTEAPGAHILPKVMKSTSAPE